MSEYIAKCNEVVGISGKALIVPDYIDTSKEIVRCRDCKYSSISFEETRTTCRFWALNDYDESNSSHGYTLYPCVKPDGFCAWGKRKEGGDGLDAS